MTSVTTVSLADHRITGIGCQQAECRHVDLVLLCDDGHYVWTHASILASRSHFIRDLVRQHACCLCQGNQCTSAREDLHVTLGGGVRIDHVRKCVELLYHGETLLRAQEEVLRVREIFRMLDLRVTDETLELMPVLHVGDVTPFEGAALLPEVQEGPRPDEVQEQREHDDHGQPNKDEKEDDDVPIIQRTISSPQDLLKRRIRKPRRFSPEPESPKKRRRTKSDISTEVSPIIFTPSIIKGSPKTDTPPNEITAEGSTTTATPPLTATPPPIEERYPLEQNRMVKKPNRNAKKTKGNMFGCRSCNDTFPTIGQLKSHNTSVHGGKRDDEIEIAILQENIPDEDDVHIDESLLMTNFEDGSDLDNMDMGNMDLAKAEGCPKCGVLLDGATLRERLSHMTHHYWKALSKEYPVRGSPNSCPICLQKFPESTMWTHVGVTHMKLYEVMSEKDKKTCMIWEKLCL